MKTNSLLRVCAMKRVVAVCVFLTLVTLGLQAQEPLQMSANAMAQISAIRQEKASWTPDQRKVDCHLLLETKKNLNQPMAAGLPPVQQTVNVGPDGRVKVDIKASVTAVLLGRIEALGGTVISSYPQYRAIQAEMPVSQIQTLAAEPDVTFISEAIPPMTNKVNTSEGDVAHAANTARALYGVNGTGVKVGVLSDSAGTTNLAALKLSGDLPDVTVLPGQAGSGTDEGVAMLEIVHDLAPGAELYFATAFGGEAGFAANIQALAAAGCQVIIDDVSYFAEPAFQDGIIAQAVDSVTSSGVAYFSSAGNSGNLDAATAGIWEGDFVTTAIPPVLDGQGYSGAQDFGGGLNYNTVTLDTSSYFTLQWSDPSDASLNDYDLILLDPTLSTVIAFSTNWQTGTQDPYEIISSTSRNDLGNKLVIVKYAGADRYMRLNANRGRLSISTSGQTWGHSCAIGAFCVAAVRATTAHGAGGVFNTSEVVEYFSSDGLRRLFFDASGAPYTPGNFSSTGGVVRQKPDITAADGVACATPGFNPFYGTSAAAPHAGAIAALLIEQGWSITPDNIRQTFANTALDIQAAGWDRDSGWGVIMADASLGAAPSYTVTFQTDGTPSATLTGTLSQTVTFGTDCTAVTANRPAGYHFVKWTKGGVDYSFSNPLTVTNVTEDKTLTAHFSNTPPVLTVASQNPNGGVSIAVYPNDRYGRTNGTTQFSCSYPLGTVVTLTAPAVAPNGYLFSKWLKDGLDFTNNTQRAVLCSMGGDHTMTAVYAHPANTSLLTVAASNAGAGVNVAIYPADKNGHSSGATQFVSPYAPSTLVTLTAPAVAPNGYVFSKWLKDGADFANNTNRAVLCSMGADRAMTAVYVHPADRWFLTVNSSNPGSGVTVAIYPADKNGQLSGLTPFISPYVPTSLVTLTAPALAPNGNHFVKWQKDGLDFANNTNRAVLCPMNMDRVMTAIYQP